MSFILDALRKSEIERQRDAAPGLMRSPLATVRHEIPVWSWLLIGLLSLALAGLAAAWWFRDQGEPGIAATVERAAPPPPSTPLVEPRTAAPDAGAAAVIAASPGEPRPMADLARADPGLPSYTLGFLAYDQDQARAYALINGTRYYLGQRIAGGPELVGIRPDGVLLAHRGQSYLLTPR